MNNNSVKNWEKVYLNLRSAGSDAFPASYRDRYALPALAQRTLATINFWSGDWVAGKKKTRDGGGGGTREKKSEISRGSKSGRGWSVKKVPAPDKTERYIESKSDRRSRGILHRARTRVVDDIGELSRARR